MRRIGSVLLLGAGRMGQRHLAGLQAASVSVDIVDPAPVARDLARAPGVRVFPSLAGLPVDRRYDAAISSTTAAGRLEDFIQLVRMGVQNILVEKPLEQSRQRTRDLISAARDSEAAVWCNHYRRTLRSFDELRTSPGPYFISVNSGAIGLGCNGIHWIDFALDLSGQGSGKLLFGEIDALPIGSGRGAQYRDYGGRGLFAFPDGSRLYLSSAAQSSAPTVLSVVGPATHWIVDQQSDRAFIHARPAGVTHPTYAYGRDYGFEERHGLESAQLSTLTEAWVAALNDSREPPQPRISEVAAAYELLFDLLESGGERVFHFT